MSSHVVKKREKKKKNREREREREGERDVHLRCTTQQVLRALIVALLPLLHARFLPRTRAVYLKIICIPAYPGCQMPAVTKVLYYTFMLKLLSARKVRVNLFYYVTKRERKNKRKKERERERERGAIRSFIAYNIPV